MNASKHIIHSNSAAIFIHDTQASSGIALVQSCKDSVKWTQIIKDSIRNWSSDPTKWTVKLVGGAQEIAACKAAAIGLGMKLAAEKVVASEPCEVYFYPETGRLRAAVVASTKKRVLIVDDSKTIQSLLQKIFARDPEIEVVGVASRPSEAEEMIKTLKPDVITLDIHMPEMDGVTFLKKYITQYPIPTVMITSISIAEGESVLKALEHGAVDYIQKPKLEELATLAPILIEKVKTAASVKVVRRSAGARKVAAGSTAEDRNSAIWLIGSSTGGTQALRAVFTAMPAEIPPTLVVQHIPPVFSKAFAKSLDDLCPFEVKEAEDGDEVLPNRVLIAPGGFQMALKRSGGGKLTVAITNDDPVNRHKPSVDYLFNSAAPLVGKMATSVILTGMGADGAKGLLKLKQAGSRTIGQDEATSVVYGMPRAAAEIGAVEKVLPLDQIPEAMVALLTRSKRAA